MTSEITVSIIVPLAFWTFDTLTKALGEIPTEDIGADLCLLGVAFNVTTFLSPSSDSSILMLMTSLVLYVFCLLVVSPIRRKDFPRPIIWLRKQGWKVSFTVFIGFFSLVSEVYFFMTGGA